MRIFHVAEWFIGRRSRLPFRFSSNHFLLLFRLDGQNISVRFRLFLFPPGLNVCEVSSGIHHHLKHRPPNGVFSASPALEAS